MNLRSSEFPVLAIEVPNLGLESWDSQIWDFLMKKVPNFKFQIWHLYHEHRVSSLSSSHNTTFEERL